MPKHSTQRSKLIEDLRAKRQPICGKCRLVKACEAIIRDFEDEDSKMIIDPSSCIHVPNHTDLCPYWLTKQEILILKGE